MNWESWPEPKNSLSAADMGRTLMRSLAVAPVRSGMVVILSRAILSILRRPMRTWFWRSSPTARTLRLPRWSMSSVRSLPSLRSMSFLTIWVTSSTRSRRLDSGISRPSRRFIL